MLARGESPLLRFSDLRPLTGEDGRDFAFAGGQTLTEPMMISKGITLLANTAVFNDDIKEWNRLPTNQKTWNNFKQHFQRAHRELRKQVTTAGQGGYNATINAIFGFDQSTNINQINATFTTDTARHLETIASG